MRFNPKARLDTSRIGDSGRSGGRGGGMRSGRGGGVAVPGRVKAGGGIGTVVVLVIFVVIQMFGGGGGGGQPGGLFGTAAGADTSRMGDSERYAHCRTGADANDDPDCARVAVENSLYNFWSQEFDATGRRFAPATVSTFTGTVRTGCGQADSQVGPFYCPPDNGIFLDTTFFEQVLEGRLGGQGGDFVEPYVLGHEYGHHVQNLTGYLGRVRTQRGPESDAVRLELQADCLAGMWTAAAESTTTEDGVAIFEDLDRGDVEEALDSAKAVGDDRIQERSGGRADPDGWTHGSSEQRMRWFLVGYEQGSFEACDTFEASSL